MILRTIKADLHVHSCLSPCGELEMSPKKIVKRAEEIGLDVIAICDHNSAKNVLSVYRAAQDSAVTVLAGMEVTTEEEVHLIGLFDNAAQALSLQKRVYEFLPPGENKEDLFGIQVIATHLDEVEAIETRMLIGGTDLSLDEVIKTIHDLGGLAIASHIDRDSFSLLSQLGMVPPNSQLDALEISKHADRDTIRTIPGVDRYPLITGSDAHQLSDLGKAVTCFRLQDISIAEINQAFLNQRGRKLVSAGTSEC